MRMDTRDRQRIDSNSVLEVLEMRIDSDTFRAAVNTILYSV